jgi:RimJ/RimL family protein N-acetyltransferase
MISRVSDPIELRPATASDLPMIEALTWDSEIAGEFAQFGWFNPRLWRQQWAENELIGEDGGVLLVVRESERLGFMNWRRKRTTPGAWYWVIGIALLPQARGHGYGTRAHRLLVRYLFAHTTAHRIEASTEAGNVAEQKALEKAGFTREGVIRAGGWRDGAWRDGVIYSILRTDPAV